MGKFKFLKICFIISYLSNPQIMFSNISDNPEENKVLLPCPWPLSVSEGLLPKIDWTDVEGAECYHLQLSINAIFLFMTVDVVVFQSEYRVLVPLIPNTQYGWRVRTGDGTNFGSFCWVSSFTTGN
ncbi:MAG: hypothetical protein L0Y79_10820 [Chlorobi bacterium]|nr:hypothetical protein [Chlorobiota bacterium]